MRPAALAVAAALLACASGPARARETRNGPYSLEVVDESGRSLPTFEERGQTWILGRQGQRYLLKIRNGSARRVEVVASVDGRDVIDGRPASVGKRGYLVEPWGEVTVDGFRLSSEAVAAFRFSSVRDSYAARTGDARDVGVIGVAVFPERRLVRPPPIGIAPRELPGRRAGASDEAAPAGPQAQKSESGASAESRRADADRPGLGTAFGEEHGSRVEQVPFERQGEVPAALLSLRYDDERGLVAQGIDVSGRRWAGQDEPWRRRQARPFPGAYAEPPPGW